MRKPLFAIILLFTACIASGQKLKKDEKQLINHLQQHIRVLSDDKLEGRRTGSPGEKIAAEYISKEFKSIGLQAKGTEGYYQPFIIDEGKIIGNRTKLSIDNKELQLYNDYFPLSLSPDTSIQSSTSLALQENGTPWFYDIKDLIEQNSENPHFDITDAIRLKAREAFKKGAVALLLYNSASSGDELSFDNKQSGTSFPLPVFYITRTAKSHFLSDPSATLDIKLTSEIQQKNRSAINVIGYIDNGAPATVIIGAHYDHIGRGEDESSTQVGYKGQIHNGADDNASGVAALMELGRLIKNSSLRNNNYLFIAFSGEELGLFGSKYFTSHPSTDLANVNYMVNMDMVGRLNDSSHVITIGGYGTSPSWGELYNQSGKHKLYSGNLIFHFDSTGTGPSDHTSFYLKDIPVLFFFTGIHSDYHKPTDDYEKINFYGEMMVVKHIYSLIEALDKQKRKLSFLKTRDQQIGQIRFSVTLGIMPDYSFIGQGVRIDAISDNRPGMNAGLKVGDVIIALGDYHFSSLEGYMRALGKFKKGDKTIVIYIRGNQTLSSPIEF